MLLDNIIKINEESGAYTLVNPLPFAFTYGDADSADVLPQMARSIKAENDADKTQYSITYTEMGGGLKISVSLTLFGELPAFEIAVRLSNTGDTNTGRIRGFKTLDLALPKQKTPYILHKACGGLANADDYTQSDEILGEGDAFLLHTSGGRSSNYHLPFFTVDGENYRLIAGIGWTGQWNCELRNKDGGLTISNGTEACDFVLYPGEDVYMGSCLVLLWDNSLDRDRAYGAFRKLILNNYVPNVVGRDKKTYLFCNTCFTRGGGWLGECNESNQLSLIKAYAPLSAEFIITDAGWFECFNDEWGWGVGNWEADPRKYPRGFKPLVDAASEEGIKYGLWFEPERMIVGTGLEKNHPEWLLRWDGKPGLHDRESVFINLGIREAVDYIYDKIEKKLTVEGIRVFRQDYNVDPLQYWRNNESADRVGMTEIKYINGLYDYLDRVHKNFPDVIMDGCAGGGRRLDLEMIKRFCTHQKTDCAFNPQIDQNSLFSLSHYLPCVCFTAHVVSYDDYKFNSAMAASLCLGWIADSEEETFGDNGTLQPGTRA